MTPIMIASFEIIEDIITRYPEVIVKDVLILRSDNCQEQYKCKYVFFEMKMLAMKYQITFVWFYGEPGHGK